MNETSTLIKLFCLCLFYWTHLLWSQSPEKADSLLKIIKTHNKVDSQTINLSNEYLHQIIYSGKADSTYLAFAEEKLMQAGKIDFTKGEVLMLQKIGILYQFYLAQPIKALDYYQKALAKIKQHPDLNGLAYSSLANIAHIYLNQQDFDKAKQQYLTIKRKFPSENVDLYLGNVYGELGNIDSAIYYFKRGVTIARRDKNALTEANGLSSLALMYARNQQSETSKNSIDSALLLIEKNDLSMLKPSTYLNACEVYRLIGEDQLAIQYAQIALEEGYTSNNLFLQKSVYATLHEAFRATNQFEKALEAHEKYVKLNDSIRSDERRVEVSRMEMEFDFKQKEQINKAALEQEQLKNRAYSIGIVLLLLIALLILYYQRKQFHLKAEKTKETQGRKLAESKLKALRAQLNPHFMFNALNSIEHFLLKHNKEETSDYLIKFSRLMRMILNQSDKNFTSLREELSLNKLYLELEQFRLANFEFSISVHPTLDEDEISVPSLYLQPFVENAVKHGMQNSSGGKIKIKLLLEKEQLVTVVEDNGEDVVPHNQKHLSKGTTISDERFEIIKSITQGEAKAERINLDKSGYAVKISFPIQYNY